MRNITAEVKANEGAARRFIDKLKVSKPALVEQLDGRAFSSRGESSGCDNTTFTSEWDSWNDTRD